MNKDVRFIYTILRGKDAKDFTIEENIKYCKFVVDLLKIWYPLPLKKG